ncbi:hypothetical protein GJ688_15865 [Heliobacillus mobilis]|uniref:Uncharacterized protein n=1 Tax=Heliobacterium mobile TaxID=28064 RepID=A0A6I3SQI5_HELMO|nr:hypothetical protein [Heliobacterium mobile]MTV50437.1 hypothetical protein [Heliobacterium mobile]
MENFLPLSIELWKQFLNRFGMPNHIAPDDILSEMARQKDHIDRLGISKAPCVLMKGPGGTCNYFIINDLAAGAVCENCGTSNYVVFLYDPNAGENLEKKTFLPRAETYEALGMTPNHPDFMRFHPVPIYPDTDLWFCPNCQSIHRFAVDGDGQLSMVQDALAPEDMAVAFSE